MWRTTLRDQSGRFQDNLRVPAPGFTSPHAFTVADADTHPNAAAAEACADAASDE